MFQTIFRGLFFVLVSASLPAQSVSGAGYVPPASIPVAPGQILTFFVEDFGTTNLSATLSQGPNTQVPVLDVRQLPMCPHLVTIAANDCSTVTALTVQIPYEVLITCLACASPQFLSTQLIVSGNGHAASIELNAFSDHVHVLTSCDIIMTTPGAMPPIDTTGLPCAPIVTHGDGKMVTMTNPAVVGETLTAWTTGLGATNPAAVTGKPSTKALPTAATLSMHYNYTPNALATKPRAPFVSSPPPAPAYSGLVPGFVGLYQINFVVPSEPVNGTPRCALPGALAASAAIYSNLTVSFGGDFSFDGAGICVSTKIPVD